MSTCHTCERRSRAAFYNRYVDKLGYASTTMLMATAYFAGIRLAAPDTRIEWRDGDVLWVWSGARSVCVRAGAVNALLSHDGKNYQITEPEHAGFFVQGRQPPTT